jgi:hypothetical protein
VLYIGVFAASTVTAVTYRFSEAIPGPPKGLSPGPSSATSNPT